MKSVFVLFALAAPPAMVSGAQSTVTPIQKVVELLKGMVAQGKKEKHEEEVQYAAFEGWCSGTKKEKETAIADAKMKVEGLEADIQSYQADATQRGEEISKLQEDINKWVAAKDEGVKVREIERADYIKTEADYAESIDALGRAIDVLKAQDYDRPGAKALLTQVRSSPLVPAASKRAIDAFIAEDPETGGIVEAPEANAYEFQSGEIVKMLEQLKDKFIDEKTVLDQEEVTATAAHDKLLQDTKFNVDGATEDISSKSINKEKAEKNAVLAQSDLDDIKATLADDEKYLADVTDICDKKAADFKARQQMRTDELEALEKAIEIMSSDEVAGAADKHLPKLLISTGTSLVQRAPAKEDPNQIRVAAYLNDEAVRINSRVLSVLAARVAGDPFAKVKTLIEELITRLMEEANSEAVHKGWCDKEMGENAHTRKTKGEAVDMLHSEIDELVASIAQTRDALTELAESVSVLDAAVAKATDMRAAEKEKNTETIKEAKEAQAAVKEAIKVLNEFYEKAAQATSLLQQPEGAPEIFDEPYKGMGAESGGVIGLLDVILSDFQRLESETTSAEGQALSEYDEFMSDSAVEKAQKTKDIEHKSEKKTHEEAALEDAKADLESTQKELDGANASYEKLKAACIKEPMSYEQRVALRKQEIESLKEALRILSGDDMAFLAIKK